YRHDGGYIDNKPGTHTYQLGDDDPATTYTITNKDLVKDNYNPVTEYGGRIALAWQPTPDWTLSPQLIYQYLNAKGGFNYDPRVGDLEVH
ncbi:hypothetical protein ABTL47_19430, partial [Acinetobacter baumannii]